MAFVEVTEISQVYFKQKFYNYGNSFEIQTQKSVCEVSILLKHFEWVDIL